MLIIGRVVNDSLDVLFFLINNVRIAYVNLAARLKS